MAQLWKSFVEALAPPQWAERPRRECVTLNRTVDEHPLSCHESSRPVESQSTRAQPENREVILADLNINPAKETHSARVAEVDSDSDAEFQDSREVQPTRSLAYSITVPKVPQVATQETQ